MRLMMLRASSTLTCVRGAARTARSGSGVAGPGRQSSLPGAEEKMRAAGEEGACAVGSLAVIQRGRTGYGRNAGTGARRAGRVIRGRLVVRRARGGRPASARRGAGGRWPERGLDPAPERGGVRFGRGGDSDGV